MKTTTAAVQHQASERANEWANASVLYNTTSDETANNKDSTHKKKINIDTLHIFSVVVDVIYCILMHVCRQAFMCGV